MPELPGVTAASANLVLSNARVAGETVDVAIADGRIASITSASGAGDGIDLNGRWVSPGLWDHHVHFTQWALARQRLDVSLATSAHAAADLVAASMSTALPGITFVGAGFRDAMWADAPSVELLDSATGGVPTVLISGDLHAVWLNSAALPLYGFAGHPTGLLREDPAFEITRQLTTVPDDVLDSWAIETGEAAAKRGVVGVIDLEMRWNLDDWQRRIANGFDSLRVVFGIYPQHLERAIAEGLRSGAQLNELLTVGRFKVLTDGSLNTRTAYCFEPYPGTDDRGMLTVSPEHLIPLMARAASAGIDPTVHAIGDHANTLALDAFEKLGCRGSIEHAQLLTATDIPRFRKLGVIASVQPDHALDDRDIADRHWVGRTSRAFALRSLLDSGAELALGSDAPVSPLDPWRTIAAAVERTRGEREPWHPEQCISVAEAMAASTRARVAVGEVADLIVTETDPLEARGEALQSMEVAATLLGGRFTHRQL